MAQERINFKISEELMDWIRTNPNILAIEKFDDKCVITHSMTGPQLSNFKSQVAQRLSETI